MGRITFVRVARFLFSYICSFLPVILVSATARGDISDNVKHSLIFVTVTTHSATGQTITETGTGFIVTSQGYAFTANHLIESADSTVHVSVASRFGPPIKAEVIGTGPGFADAALLQLPQTLGPYHSIRFGDPFKLTPGSGLTTVGFPLESDASVVTGVLSNTSGKSGLWQMSVPLAYGNSGGPVMDSEGRVVGMVKGGVKAAQAVNYMIPLNLLAPLLNAAGVPYPPFEIGAEEMPNIISPLPPALVEVAPNQQPPDNCREVVRVASGLPPVYTKRLECD